MIVIGVIGAAAVGKSTISHCLHRMFGFAVFDADAVVHRLYDRDKEVICAVKKLFPSAVGDVVDRVSLSSCLRNNRGGLQQLQQVVYPHVKRRLIAFLRKSRMHQLNGIVLDVPGLYVIGAHKYCDSVIEVTSNYAVHSSRFERRNNFQNQKEVFGLKGYRAYHSSRFLMAESIKHRIRYFVVKNSLSKSYLVFSLRSIVKRLTK